MPQKHEEDIFPEKKPEPNIKNVRFASALAFLFCAGTTAEFVRFGGDAFRTALAFVVGGAAAYFMWKFAMKIQEKNYAQSLEHWKKRKAKFEKENA